MLALGAGIALVAGGVWMVAQAAAPAWQVVDGCSLRPRTVCPDAVLRDLRVTRPPDLRYAVLTRADLGGAQLDGAVLHRADLRNARLADATLRRAVVTETDLRGADLRGADLRAANLRGARLDGAQFCRTIMPDGRPRDGDCGDAGLPRNGSS